MKEQRSLRSPRLLLYFSLLVLLTLALGACSTSGSTPGSGSTPTSTAGYGTGGSGSPSGTPTASDSTPAHPAGIQLGPQPCPDAVSSPAHWDPIVGTQANVSQVGRVTCAYMEGKPSLQALILVGYQGTGNIVDIYVYDNITDPNPTQVFKLQGLYKGDAKISAYNTILTSEVDQNSGLNIGKSNAALVPDLFREFKWSDAAGTLVQVAFPGIYPDLTRFEAENDQAQVNAGHDGWKLDAAQVSTHLVNRLLGWPADASATVTSGGGTHDVNAVVTVRANAPGTGTITVTLSRLEGNANGGIWIAIAVSFANTTITSPVSRDRLTSPVTVTGTGNAFEGVIGTVRVLDHLYNDIGHADVRGTTGNGNTSFSANLTYTASFHGVQEGLLVLLATNNAGGPASGAVILKELISG